MSKYDGTAVDGWHFSPGPFMEESDVRIERPTQPSRLPSPPEVLERRRFWNWVAECVGEGASADFQFRFNSAIRDTGSAFLSLYDGQTYQIWHGDSNEDGWCYVVSEVVDGFISLAGVNGQTDSSESIGRDTTEPVAEYPGRRSH